jgi:type I restriction enzyme, S subunit
MKTKTSQKNIPEGWNQVRLGSIADFKKGKGLSKSDLSSDGKYNAIHYGELFTKYNEKITKILSKTNSVEGAFLSKKNDILMPTSDVTPRGLSTASYLDKEGVVLGGDVLVIRAKTTQLNGLFFSYFVSSQKKEVIKLVSGTTVFHLYGSDMAKLVFSLPSLPEQNRIVAVLEVWDMAIELLTKKIELKKQVKKGLMQKLLTGKLRLPGFMEKWKVVQLGEVVERIRRKNTINNLNILTISGQQGLISQSRIFYKRIAADNLENYNLLERGDFAYNKSYSNGYPMGAIKRLKAYESGVVSSLYITFKATKIDQTFLDFYFENGLFNRALSMVAQEGARNHGLLNIGIDEFLSGDIHIPESKAEQNAIAEILASADKEVTELGKKLINLKEQKRYLLNNLIAGTIRTPETLKL